VNTRVTRLLALSGVALCTVGLVSACSGSKKKVTPTSAPTSAVATTGDPSSAAPSTSSVAPAARPAVNPLTGVGKTPATAAVGVKIDDTENARPQVNIDQADIVYIEEAEGGLTRLLAVFDSALPTVGYVRSVRASDPELLAQYGAIDFVASGGAANPLQVLDASPLKTSINDRSGPGLSRDTSRGEPYNVLANLAQVTTALKGAPAKSIGFAWSKVFPGLATTPRGTDVKTQVGATGVEFKYNAATKMYERYIDGVRQLESDGKPVATPNVIVQACVVTAYPQDVDVNGNPSQYTHTIGTGAVYVFRGGHEITGTWTRKSGLGGTALKTTLGKTIWLSPGGAWVALVRTGATVTGS
jgi:hypothetical protein